MRLWIMEQLNCDNEVEFLMKILNVFYKKKLLSTDSMAQIRNKAMQLGHSQKKKYSSTKQTVCQYVEQQYEDRLSRLNSDIINCLGEFLTQTDSYNFGRTNKQIYIETSKKCYKKKRRERKEDNKKRFYFKYIYFNNMISSQRISIWDLGGIDSKYVEQIHWYKNTKFSKVFDYWEHQHGLKKENQLVYHFSERQNHTLRPNREIFTFPKHRKDKYRWPKNENDIIYKPLSMLRNNYSYSIYRTVRDSAFILFDKTALHKVKNTKNTENTENKENKEINTANKNGILLILKYFDVFHQKVILEMQLLQRKIVN